MIWHLPSRPKPSQSRSPPDDFSHATHIGGDEQILAQYGTAGKGTKKARNPASRVDPIRRRVQGRLAAVVERNRTTLAVLGPQRWSQRAMLTSNDYKELAARCTELASEFSEPAVAEALSALASDYLALAAKLHHQTAD